MTLPPRLLDWRDRKHWSTRAKPCQYCGGPTHLRDNQRRPAHKVCAEHDLTKKDTP